MKAVIMRLPKHLEIMRNEDGLMLFGMGPYTMYVRNNDTKEITRIVIPMPSPYQENLPDFFRRMFQRALKEQMNEDIEYRQSDSEHDSDVC